MEQRYQKGRNARQQQERIRDSDNLEKTTKSTQTRLSSAAATAMISTPNQLSQPNANSRF
jgi:flagellin-like hook-associated protein FlgL